MNDILPEDIQKTKASLMKAIEKYSYKEDHENMFSLASGKKSPYYFDLKQTLLNPVYLKMTAFLIYSLIREKLNDVPSGAAGLTMGSDPIIYALALLTSETEEKLYPLIVRKQEKDHGSKKRIEGLIDAAVKKEVILIDDVITTGGSTLQANEALRQEGIRARYAFSVLDRIEGGFDNLKKEGVELFSLFNLNDFRKK
ncbi:MAG: orotate phosphoribosyltransferase [Spirochaetia bacterium]|nr:orotate phosphoribosyltransferase [Spirochaetia bacterium]